MTIQPTRNYIVVELRDARKSTIAGLELPDGVKTEPYAVVLRVGPSLKVQFRPCNTLGNEIAARTLLPGDRVAFLPNCGPIKLDEYQPDGTKRSVFVIHEDVVFGVFEGEPAVVTGDTTEAVNLPRSNFNT